MPEALGGRCRNNLFLQLQCGPAVLSSSFLTVFLLKVMRCNSIGFLEFSNEVGQIVEAAFCCNFGNGFTVNQELFLCPRKADIGKVFVEAFSGHSLK